MSLLTLLVMIIGLILYIFIIKLILPKLNCAEYVTLCVYLGVGLFLLALAHMFGVWNFLSSVRI
jgi:hypothetical protein